MKIQFASDFHLEHDANVAFLEQSPLKPVGDVLVLAGDITVLGGKEEKFEQFARWCSEHFEHTLIVPGNHEFYGGHDIAPTLEGWEKEILPGVKMACNKSIMIDDVEFLLTTLWSHVPADAEPLVNKYMAECNTGVYRGEPFKACHYSEVHSKCRAWLDNALAHPRAEKRVIVTHHCPVRAEDPRYESNGLSNAFVNPMEDYVAASGASAWIHGHTHYNGASGTVLGKTMLCSNQLGYADKGVCSGYLPDAVITI